MGRYSGSVKFWKGQQTTDNSPHHLRPGLYFDALAFVDGIQGYPGSLIALAVVFNY